MLYHSLLVGKTLRAPLAITSASIARTHKFCVVQRPYHPCPLLMRNLRNHRTQLRMNIIQMHHLRLKVIHQPCESFHHLTSPKRPCKRIQLRHVRRPIPRPFRLLILRVLHGINSHIMPLLLQHLLQVHGIDAVTATAVIKLIC